MLFNYAIGSILGNGTKPIVRKYILWFGVSINLLFLGYFKYANFFVEELNQLISLNFNLEKILLPLAISFFTFQQIAFLVDSYRHETKEFNFLQYCLFVTFFPQLIAGPIVHHKEMMPQFSNNKLYKINYEAIATGTIIFTIGLFKKVIFADSMALYATPVFAAAEAQATLTFFEAWGGALAYTLQLYFDFSGYSDMAIGIALMFGIILPFNFNSPYKAMSIIDFWRRWHITLSRFLRDYLYITMGGSRKGNIRRYVNLFITMLLGGIWHGAGWTFIIWGMLHGSYLMINHAWRNLRFNMLKLSAKIGIIESTIARLLTLLAVIIGWVYFRAETLEAANHMVLIMFADQGISLPTSLQSILGNLDVGLKFNGMFGGSTAKLGEGALWIMLLLFATLVLPNNQQIISFTKNNVQSKTLNSLMGLMLGITLYYLFTQLSSDAEFLYFNF